MDLVVRPHTRNVGKAQKLLTNKPENIELAQDEFAGEHAALKGVLLRGGHGTRLIHLTHNGPKQLIQNTSRK